MIKILLFTVLFAYFIFSVSAQGRFEIDNVITSAGNLKITFLGHGSLMFTFNEMVIYVDPYSRVADYSVLPKADLILITHEHNDHFDLSAINVLSTENTKLILTETCAKRLSNGVIMRNGDVQIINDLKFEAVPAYNIIHKRDNGQPFHPRGAGNGYIITFGDKRIYIAGDTENIPEMKTIKDIDIAFLPMNLPYTMTPEMVTDAVKMFNPKIIYPYHYGNTDTSKLVELLKDYQGVEVRIRKM